jgi:hypothetical protein
MAKQTINVGSAPNDSTGDQIRTAFQKINENFTELYSNGGGSSNFRLTASTITTASGSGNISIAPSDSAAVYIGNNNRLFVSSSENSTDPYSGALVVAGGVGVAGKLYGIYGEFTNIDNSIIGASEPAAGNFTNILADTLSATTITSAVTNSGNVVSDTMYVATQADFYHSLSKFSNLGESVAANLVVTETLTANNAVISNVKITSGSIDGISISINSINATPVGNVTPSTGDFTWANTTNFVSGNVKITGGTISGVNISPVSVNGAPIGNATPDSGAFTTLSTSGITSFNNTTDSTSKTLGAVKVAGGLGVAANIWADIVHAAHNGAGTNFRIGDDAWLGDINQTNSARLMGVQDNSKGYLVFGNGDTATLGRSGTGALTYTGDFTASTIRAATVNAGTIGNTGASLVGTVSTAAQTSITSVGTLTNLTVSGTANITDVRGNIAGPINGVVGGSVPNAATFTEVTVNGNLIVSNFSIIGNLSGIATSATTAGTATYASTAGLAAAATTVVQPHQGNITGLGILSNLRVTTTAIVGNLDAYTNISAGGNINAANQITSQFGSFGYLNVVEGNLRIFTSHTIGNSIGVDGDKQGRIVWNASYLYVCTQDYDGVTNIWKRIPLNSF